MFVPAVVAILTVDEAESQHRRRYDAAVLERLRIVRTAQEVGLTLEEIQDLFRNDKRATPFSARWPPLAEHKLAEVGALIARAQVMQQILEESLRCGCMSLEECVIFVRQAHDAGGQVIVADGGHRPVD